MKHNILTPVDIDRIIEMAWEDRTPFDAIETQFGLKDQQVIALMRTELKPASWRKWRARVKGRSTKHLKLSHGEKGRFKCSRQKMISYNKVT